MLKLSVLYRATEEWRPKKERTSISVDSLQRLPQTDQSIYRPRWPRSNPTGRRGEAIGLHGLTLMLAALQ